MSKPDFLIIGAMKCATSTVTNYLEQHPQAEMVPGLEPCFFAADENFARGFDWYEGLFPNPEGRLLGESSNDYAERELYPECAQRIADYLPNVKLIYMVRDPIKRVFSSYLQLREQSPDVFSADFFEAVQQHTDRMVGPSRYMGQLEHYRKHFPENQIFVGFMEDLKTEPEEFFARLSDFLGIDEFTPDKDDSGTLHRNRSDEKMLPSEGYDQVRGLPGYKMIKRAVSPEFRSWIKQRLFLKPAASVKPSAEAETWLRDQLAEDAAAFLADQGKPADFWNI